MFTDSIPQEVDFLVVGGGTAGPVVASRLAEASEHQVFLAEWGPDDSQEDRANTLRRWDEMLEGEYDLDYRSVEQERGNSDIRMSRLKILGGCSNGNTMITWRPLKTDLEEWVSKGAEGWTPENVWPFYDQLKTKITPVAEQDQNSHVKDVIEAACSALDMPKKTTWNDHVFTGGAGFFEVGYEPETNQRSSASYSYLHASETPGNLQVGLGLRAVRLLVEGGVARGAIFKDKDGLSHTIRAQREVILCCGAIDSPRLLMLSGIGPKAVLDAAGVECQVDLPGVGENLQDHAEGIVVWQTKDPIDAAVCASGWDGGYVVSDENGAPLFSTHIPVETWGVHVENYLGSPLPDNNISLVPNVSKPHSSGRVWITDGNPDTPPSVDYRYFTDPEGKDESVVIAGIRAARRVAEEEPFASKIVREIFPGPDVQDDEGISRMARATHQTVYHVSGTCKIGANDDEMAVVDPRLAVRGVLRLRVVDASVFPSVTGLNPVGTVLTVAERAASLILEDAD